MLMTRIITAAHCCCGAHSDPRVGRCCRRYSAGGRFGGIAAWELARCFPSLKAFPGKEVTLGLSLVLVLCFYACLTGAACGSGGFPLVVLFIHLLLYNVIENTIDSVGSMVFVPCVRDRAS